MWLMHRRAFSVWPTAFRTAVASQLTGDIATPWLYKTVRFAHSFSISVRCSFQFVSLWSPVSASLPFKVFSRRNRSTPRIRATIFSVMSQKSLALGWVHLFSDDSMGRTMDPVAAFTHVSPNDPNKRYCRPELEIIRLRARNIRHVVVRRFNRHLLRLKQKHGKSFAGRDWIPQGTASDRASLTIYECGNKG